MQNSVAQQRKARQWSQQKLADLLGVSRQTVISIEKARFDPSLPLAFQLAKTFDCTIEDLFNPDSESSAQTS